jgi:hypothetical protein
MELPPVNLKMGDWVAKYPYPAFCLTDIILGKVIDLKLTGKHQYPDARIDWIGEYEQWICYGDAMSYKRIFLNEFDKRGF